MIFQKLVFCTILIPKKPQRQKSNYLNNSGILDVQFQIQTCIWQKGDSCVTDIFFFLITNEKSAIQDEIQPAVSEITISQVFLYTCIHIQTFVCLYICVYFVHIKIQEQWTIATCQLVLFSCRQGVHRKIMQLHNHEGDHEDFCISSMLPKPWSDTRLCILVTPVSINSYTITTEVTTTKSYLRLLLLHVTSQSLSLDLLPLCTHSLELGIWLTTNWNGGLNPSKLEMVSVGWKKQMYARLKFVSAPQHLYL